MDGNEDYSNKQLGKKEECVSLRQIQTSYI